MKMVSIEKLSKKAQREFYSSQRTIVRFDTGTKIFKTDKHPSRARSKEMSRKAEY